MRLVIATPFLETKGGMERVVLKIAERFDARIHCLSYDRDNTFEGFQKLAIETPKPSFLSKIPIGKRIFSAMDAGNHFYGVKLDPKEYDLINAHQTPSEWIRNRNSPVIFYCHTPNREAFDLYEWRMKKRNPLSKAMFWASIQAYKHFEFETVPKIEYIFTNSKNSQDRIKKYLKRDSEVLHPGVELSKFSCRSFDNFFFYPSRITPEKEIEYAIESFKLFKKRAAAAGGSKAGSAPGSKTESESMKPETENWKLVIAGGLSKRPEHQDYLKRLKSMCDDSISIETNISEEHLLDLYARCYAVLYTPVNEDYGLVPLEAFASSKPCIARNEGGPRETITDRQDGFLINSVFEMSERMEQLAKSPDQCRIMGKQGRKKVEASFTWDVFLNRFEEKAKEIVEKKSAL